MEHNNGVKMKNPCNGCRYRHISCHSTCFLYKEWKHQTEVLNGMLRKDKDMDSEISGVRKARVRGRRK